MDDATTSAPGTSSPASNPLSRSAAYAMLVFQMWLFIGLTTIGLQFVPARRSAILAYTMPLWVFPAAVPLFGEKLTPWKLIGMALGLAGLIVLLNPASVATVTVGIGNTMGWLGVQAERHVAHERLSAFPGLGYAPGMPDGKSEVGSVIELGLGTPGAADCGSLGGSARCADWPGRVTLGCPQALKQRVL